MEFDLDLEPRLDRCPRCNLPTFDHEQVALVNGEFLHLFCFTDSVMVAKRSDLVVDRETI
jgi:hypothetical protein